MKKIGIIFGIALVLMIISTLPADAQCAMCRATGESNLAAGGTAGKGLNGGILYMLATPYVIIGTLAFIWWRNKRKKSEQEMMMDREVPSIQTR